VCALVSFPSSSLGTRSSKLRFDRPPCVRSQAGAWERVGGACCAADLPGLDAVAYQIAMNHAGIFVEVADAWKIV
jgi:hypothetical protein